MAKPRRHTSPSDAPTVEELSEWAAEARGLAETWRERADDEFRKDADRRGGSDLADMYLEDADDADRIAALLEGGDFNAALVEVHKLDTLPRESYGWSVASSRALWRSWPELGGQSNPAIKRKLMR